MKWRMKPQNSFSKCVKTKTKHMFVILKIDITQRSHMHKRMSSMLSQSQTTLNQIQSPVNNNSLHVTNSVPTSWSAPNSLSAQVNGWIDGTVKVRRPKHLESLYASPASPVGLNCATLNELHFTDLNWRESQRKRINLKHTYLFNCCLSNVLYFCF